jgi:outer membrane cobalamin receptor
MTLRRREAARRVAASLAAALVAGEAVAAADDTQDLTRLLNENVVSGASKSLEVASDAPATTTTITAADMRRYGIRSLDEAIDFLGLGLVTQNPLHSVDIGGRGVLLTSDFGNHVLLVVDGHVMNEPWDGTAYFEQGAAIPIDLIDHIELVLGPGSVLYGGNAMIGVVNVVTKRAASYRGLHFTAEAGLSPQQGQGGTFTSFAPKDLGNTYRLASGIGHEFTLLGTPAELTAGVELYRQNGPSFQWGPQTATNDDGTPVNFGPRTPPGVWGGRTYDQYATSVPAAQAKLVVGDLTVWARGATYWRTTPYVNGFNQTLSDFDDARSYELDRWAQADVRYRKLLSRTLELQVRGYADAYDYLQHQYASQGSNCAVSTTGACLQVTRGESQWAGSEIQAQYDWTGAETLTTMVGVDARVRHVAGRTDATAGDTGQLLARSGDRSVAEPVWAAYVQQRYRPLDPIHLNAGVRFDADPRGGSRFSPRAAVAVDAWKGGVARAIYSEAFRSPTFYEAFFQDAQQHPAPDIHAEVVRGVECSIEQTMGSHRVLMGVFRTWWSDMISLEALPDGSYQYRNVASIDNYGYNARADGTLGPLRYGLSVTGAHTRGNGPDGDHPLPVAPQIFGNARLSYDLPELLPDVALATTFVGRRPADRALDGGFTPTPYAGPELRLRATASERFPAVPGLSYRLGAEYVTAAVSPYVAGPTQTVDPSLDVHPSAELAPINRFTVFATLQYDLPL